MLAGLPLTYFRLDLTIRERLSLTVRAEPPRDGKTDLLLYLHPARSDLATLAHRLRSEMNVSHLAVLDGPIPMVLARMSCPAGDTVSVFKQLGTMIESLCKDIS